MQFILISVTAALGGLLFGYDTGVISSALLFVRTVFHLSTAGQSLCRHRAGRCRAGRDRRRHPVRPFGSRLVILVTALAFVIGALLSPPSPAASPVLLEGRLLIGIAIRVASMLTPLYLAEIAPAASAGR